MKARLERAEQRGSAVRAAPSLWVKVEVCFPSSVCRFTWAGGGEGSQFHSLGAAAASSLPLAPPRAQGNGAGPPRKKRGCRHTGGPPSSGGSVAGLRLPFGWGSQHSKGRTSSILANLVCARPGSLKAAPAVFCIYYTFVLLLQHLVSL